jgi:hypothetical protein
MHRLRFQIILIVINIHKNIVGMIILEFDLLKEYVWKIGCNMKNNYIKLQGIKKLMGCI